MSDYPVGWKGVRCFECKGPVDQDADIKFWFHLDPEPGVTDHEITPCIDGTGGQPLQEDD